MRSDLSDVRDFHVKFGLPVNHPDIQVHTIDPEVFDFRLKFLLEEYEEYRDAYFNEDLVTAVDSLIDLAYVAYGAALFMGAAHRYAWPSMSSVRIHHPPITPTPSFLPQPVNILVSDEIVEAIDAFDTAHEVAVMGHPTLHRAIKALTQVTESVYFAAALMNIPWEECWSHVQAANMAKVRARRDGSDSKRGTSWDVVKPPGWTAPNEAIRLTLKAAGALV